jgi:hypothetical protein
MKKTLLLSLFIGASLLAQTKPAEPAKPPAKRAVPVELENEYNRADAAVAKAKPVWDGYTADLQAASTAIQKYCGEQLVSIEGKHYVCVTKPEPEKEAPKAPAK